MKPLTEKQKWRSPLSERDLFTREDVLSALALLKKVIGEEMKYIIEKPCADADIAIGRNAYINGLQKALELIDECFDIQEQGNVKRSRGSLKTEFNQKSKRKDKPCVKLASLRDSPAQLNKKETKQ